MPYQRILFPDRAEAIRSNPKLQQGYKVFLQHWRPHFLAFLRQSYEGVSTRRSSFALVVYGQQGVGKTMLADKLRNDFEETKKQADMTPLTFDETNLWHLIAAGHRDIGDLMDATAKTDVIVADEESNWIELITNNGAGVGPRRKIIIIDNAERAYFGAALAGMDPSDYIARSEQPATFVHIAQQFVRLARGTLQGCLFIILGNNASFLQKFVESCDAQHKGMSSYEVLPLPLNEEKERIVRININRLNPVSYWACVDKSGPDKKSILYNSITGTDTFPDTFNAVDDAFADSFVRQGRPANKCMLTLALLTRDLSIAQPLADHLSNTSRSADFFHSAAGLFTVTDDYAQIALPGRADEAKLLESEFTLLILVLSDVWVRELLGNSSAQARAIDVLNSLLQYPRVGDHQRTRDDLKMRRNNSCNSLVASSNSCSLAELDEFWSKGIVRSAQYERILKSFFPEYNTKPFTTGLNIRPDLLVSPYDPCSVLAARSQESEHINESIRRYCHAVEFTAQPKPTIDTVVKYLSNKLVNYIELLQSL